jgi:hypothetical protein
MMAKLHQQPSPPAESFLQAVFTIAPLVVIVVLGRILLSGARHSTAVEEFPFSRIWNIDRARHGVMIRVESETARS